MKSLLARVIFLILLVGIILVALYAIENPPWWKHVERLAAQDWVTVEDWFRSSTVTTPKATPHPTPAPATPPATPPVMMAEPWTAPAPIAPMAQLSASQRALLMAARTAFWRQEYAVALADYQSLIAATPQISRLYGEMGNVLWHAGHPFAAGQAYAQAADILVRHQQYDQAAALMPVLQATDPYAAQQLRQRLAH